MSTCTPPITHYLVLLTRVPQHYRDDDLKGKGEPSFSRDQARRSGKQPASDVSGGTVYYEMQQPSPSSRGYRDSKHKDGGGATHVRQRSVSNGGAQGRGRAEGEGAGDAGSSGLQRRNTAGKNNLAQSLKRRLGSLRKRRVGVEETGY